MSWAMPAAMIASSVLPGLMDKIFPGKQEQMQQIPNMTGEQQSLLNNLGGGLQQPNSQMMQYLSQIMSGSPEAMQAFEKPYMTQFNQQTIPHLLEGLTGAGGMRSSALGQQMGAAGAGLSEQLAALRGQLQQAAMGHLGSLTNSVLGSRPFENVFRPATMGAGSAIAPGLMQAVGNIGSAYYGNKLQNQPSPPVPPTGNNMNNPVGTPGLSLDNMGNDIYGTRGIRNFMGGGVQ